MDIQSSIGQRTGVGNYTAHLAEALAHQKDLHDLNLSFFYFDFKRNGHSVNLPKESERAIRWCPGRLMEQAWKRFAWPPYENIAGHADVYHFPNFIIPPLHKGKTIVTIHDLAFLRFPETIEAKNLIYLRSKISDTITRADAIIAVSQFTADELQTILHVPPEKIHVIHEGLCELPSPPAADKSAAILQKLKIGKRFLLSVGTVEPRKNYEFLIHVFDQLDDDIELVIAGGWGWKYGPILERIKKSPKADKIHVTGYLTREELAALYTRAELFVYPTLYEGFGFPPLEAMHYQLPVLSAYTPPLPEILGDAAAWVDRYDATEWAATLSALLADTSRQHELIITGSHHIQQYTWEKAAQQTIEVYQKVYNS